MGVEQQQKQNENESNSNNDNKQTTKTTTQKQRRGKGRKKKEDEGTSGNQTARGRAQGAPVLSFAFFVLYSFRSWWRGGSRRGPLRLRSPWSAWGPSSPSAFLPFGARGAGGRPPPAPRSPAPATHRRPAKHATAPARAGGSSLAVGWRAFVHRRFLRL